MSPAESEPPRTPPRAPARARQRMLGLCVSLAIHALIIGLLWKNREFLSPSPLAGDALSGLQAASGGGGGGGRVSTYIIALTPPPLAPAVTKPVPPVVPPKSVEIPIVKAVPTKQPVIDTSRASQGVAPAPGSGSAAGQTPGSGGGAGGGTGGGTGPGTGPGTGAGGGGGGVRPPELRGLALPFGKPPKELRGKTITVLFSITTDGRVDHFETQPEITDRGFYKKFSEVVMGYRFKPARGPDGQPVAVVFPMQFDLQTSE